MTKHELKIAGEETCKRAYEELLKNKEFSDSVRKIIPYLNLKDYSAFNRVAPMVRGDGEKAFQMFKEFMQQKGFSGIIDLNDKTGYGLQTESPIIFFGGNSNFSTKSIRQLTRKDINKGLIFCQKDAIKKALLSDENLLVSGLIGGYFSALSGVLLISNDGMAKQAYENEKK